MWWLYEVLLIIGLLSHLPKALWRRRLPHRGWAMRLGRYPQRVAETLGGRSSLWLHAVSVGETLAAQPLVTALTASYPALPLVFSTVTPSGFEVASKRLDNRGTVVYFPLDFQRCVHRALNTLQPRALLLMESELWPNMIRLARQRGIPVIVINGRISPRSFRRAQRLRSWVSSHLNQITLFLMQSQLDADHLLQLGVPASRMRVVGSLKWDASLAARPTTSLLTEAAAQLGLRNDESVVVAGSTHHGEEEAILDAVQAARALQNNIRLILAPRHLERLDDVEALCRRRGLTIVRTSQAASRHEWQVALVDVFGRLPRYYGLATVAVIGGSFIPHGGQNPLEPASLGKPIIFGPFMHNFAEIAQQLTAHHAARQLEHSDQLAPVLLELLTRPSEARAMGARAQALTEQSRGTVQRTLDALAPFLQPRD